MNKNKISFDELFSQNERRFQYYKNLRIDSHHEFFNEGLVIVWRPYRQYRPDLGLMATYFSYVIRVRLMRNHKK